MSLSRSLLVLCLLSTSVSAYAQDSEDDARHHFRLGQAHYESSHFEESAAEFEIAFELSGRVALLHNVYVAYRDAGDQERAADALRRYLEADPDAPNASHLRGRLAALERSIAGRAEHSDDPEPADPEPAATSDTAPATTSSDPSGGGFSPIGFVVSGVGAAALVTSIVTGLLAADRNDTLAATCPDQRCPADFDFESVASEGSTLALTTDVLLGVGGALLVTGVVLIFTLEGDDEAATTARASCGPTGCRVDVLGRF